MAYDLSMFSLANQVNPENIAKDYQQTLTGNIDRQAKGLGLAQAQQGWADQQAQRTALQQNYDPTTGNVDLPGLAGSDYAKQNPQMAQAMAAHIRQNGLDKSAQTSEEASNYFAKMSALDPSDKAGYNKIRQEAVASGHPEFGNLPDVPIQSTINRGLMNSMGAKEQVDNMMKMRSGAMEMLKKYNEDGVEPPPELYQAAGFAAPGQDPRDASQRPLPTSMSGPGGVRPGESRPMGKRDMTGQKAYDDALANRHLNDPAYPTAGANLLAAQNMKAVFNKYKNPDGTIDYSKINTQDANTLALESAKLKKGGTPTEDEVDRELPPGPKAWLAKKGAGIMSEPLPMGQPEFYKGMDQYADEVKANSENSIQKAHTLAAADAQAAGISGKSLAIKRAALAKELEGRASGTYQPPKGSAEKKSNTPPPLNPKTRQQMINDLKTKGVTGE